MVAGRGDTLEVAAVEKLHRVVRARFIHSIVVHGHDPWVLELGEHTILALQEQAVRSQRFRTLRAHALQCNAPPRRELQGLIDERHAALTQQAPELISAEAHLMWRLSKKLHAGGHSG